MSGYRSVWLNEQYVMSEDKRNVINKRHIVRFEIDDEDRIIVHDSQGGCTVLKECESKNEAIKEIKEMLGDNIYGI